MAEAISIDALLRLKTEYAIKQLSNLGKNQKPVTIPVKFKADKVSKTFADITASAISTKLKSSFNVIGDDLVTKIEDAFSKTKIKVKGGGGLFGGLTNIVTAPLQGIARGAFEGVGREVSKKFSTGLSKGIEQQASQFIGSFDLVGEKLVTKVIPGITSNAIARIKDTLLGNQLAKLVENLDISEARESLKKQIGELLGDTDLLIEQEFSKSQKSKAKNQKRKIAQKEVASQFVKELKQQPQVQIRQDVISEQIKQLEEQSVRMRLRLKKIAQITDPSLGMVEQVKSLIKSLDVKKKQITQLRIEQSKLFKPVAQQKLSRLGVNTSNIDAVIPGVEKISAAAQKTLNDINTSRVDVQKDIDFARSQLLILQERLAKLQQAAKQALSNNEIPLARAIATKIVKSKEQILSLEQALKTSSQKLQTLAIKESNTQEIIDSELQQKLTLSLQQQIEVISQVLNKQQQVIFNAVAQGQQAVAQKIVSNAVAKSQQDLVDVQKAIDKAIAIDRNQLEQEKEKFNKTTFARLQQKAKELQNKILRLNQVKTQLVNANADDEEIDKVTRQIDSLIKILSKANQFVTKSINKRVNAQVNLVDAAKNKVIKLSSKLEKLRRDRTDLIFRRDKLNESINEETIARITSDITIVANSLKIANKELAKAQSTTVTTELDKQQFIKARQNLVKNAEIAQASLQKTEQAVDSTIEYGKNTLELLQQKLAKLNSFYESGTSQIEQKTQQAVNLSPQQEIINKVARQIEKISKTAFENIPQVKTAKLPEGMLGFFNKQQNAIVLPPDTFKNLNPEGLNQEIVELLAHELRHALQFQIAKAKGGIDKLLQTSNFLLTPSESESQVLEQFIKLSEDAAKGSLTKEQVRALEQDAYTFAYRYVEQISENISQVVKTGLDKLLSQIKPIALPKTPAISSRAFPVINSSDDLQKLLEKQISASGLKQLVKRLGLGTDSPIKEVAIERVVNAYKQDAIKVQELIARFGDDIRLKSAKIGASSSFGNINDEPALTASFKTNQKILQTAYSNLDKLSDEQRKIVAQKIQAIAQEQIATIDKATREFKLSGKTGQSLSGTRSQLANINDSSLQISLSDVGKGISVGTEKEISTAKKAGGKLSDALNDSFRKGQGIDSPSKERIKDMHWVVAGIADGANRNTKQVLKAGEKLGEFLNKGFRKSQGINSKSRQRIKDMYWVAVGVVAGVEHNIQRVVKAGKRLGDSFSDGFLKSGIYKGQVADRAAKQVQKQIEKIEKANSKSVANAVRRIQNNFKKVNNILNQQSRQVTQQEQSNDRENAQKVAQALGDIFTEKTSNKEKNKGVLEQLKVTIASMQNDLRNAGIAKASKEAQKVTDAAKDLLDRLKTSVTVGKDATAKIRQANKAIANLEKLQAKAIKGIGKLKGAEKLKVKAFVDRIQSKIEEEQRRVAGLKQEQVQAKKLLPVYKQLTKLNQQLQQAIANQDAKKIRRLNAEISKVFTRINQPPPTPPGGGFLGKLERQLAKIGITGKRVITTLKGLAGLAIGSIFIGGLDDVVRNISAVGLRFEQLETQINFAAGSAKKGAENFAFAAKEASRLKIDIEQAIAGYASLSAATKNSDVLRGQTERIFQVITQASRVTGATAQQTEAAFLAIQQMISGGTLQLEELRQLGESGGIKGVFDIAQKALGAADGEMKKLISTGTVAIEDFLPKFINQLDKVTRNGVSESLNTMSAALAGVQNEFKLLQVELSKSSRGITTLALNTVAKGLELVRNNLNLIKPVLQTTVGLVAIALLPAALKLGKFLTGMAVKGLGQIITLLGVTNTQLGVTNAQLILLQSMSPRMAFLVSTIGNLTAAFKLFSGATAVWLTFQIAEALMNTAQAGKEVRGVVDQINDAMKRLNLTLAKNDPTQIGNVVEANKKKLAETRNYYQKGTDAAKKFLKSDNLFAKTLTRVSPVSAILAKSLTFEEAQLSRVKAATGEAIAANQQLLRAADRELGLGDLGEKSTEDLQAYAEAIEATSQQLEKASSSAVNSNQFNAIKTELAENQKRLDRYNKELARREGKELNLGKIIVERNETVTAATKAETDALAAIDAEMLKSGDFKKDVELQKLNYAKARLDAELTAEKTALAKIQQLATQKGTLDPKTGKPRNSQQLAEFEKIQKRINELQRSAVENGIALTRKEVEQKLAEYDRYLDKLQDKQKEAINIATTAEKERLIEIQQLLNDEVISKEQAEELKARQTRDRITDELAQEEYKLHELQKYTSTEIEVQEKRDEDIMASRQKVLDLTLQLLQEEKAAEERTISAISKSRNDALSSLEKRLSSLQQLIDTEANLLRDRATSEEKLADLQIAKLRQALELRQQLNSGELNARERQTALRQLHSIGIDGRTDELSLLDRIEDREKKLAKFKLDNLEKQQQAEQAKLDLENQKYILAVKTAKLEAEKGQREAEKELISAEQAVLSAETDEELETANKLYELAKLNLDIANLEAIAAKEQLNELDSIVKRKKENLALSQAIARAEAKGTNVDDEFKREQDRNIAREDRANRRGYSGDRYLSRNEKIDAEVVGRKEKVESIGGEFTAKAEAALKQKLQRQYRQAETNQERSVRQNLRGNPGFSIEAPKEILDAIRNGKPFTVPVIPKFKTDVPLEVGVLGKTKGSTSQDNMILKTLQNIEKKFEQPKVVNVSNDNQFINKYERNNTDELMRRFRSEQLEAIRSIADEL